MRDRETALQAFAFALRRRRFRRGLSQEQVANEGGLSRSHLSDLEGARVEPKLTTFLELARVLGVPASSLMRDVERVYVRLEKLRQARRP